MDWRNEIVEHFSNKGSIYIVKDNDGILRRKDVFEFLEQKKIDILEFDDPIYFRYVYERDYRFSKERTLLIIISSQNFESLPWDVYQKSFRMTLDFNNILSKMDRFALRQLPSEYLTVLYEQSQNLVERMNECETYASVLEAVLAEPNDLVNEDSDIIDELHRYWKKYDIPVPDSLKNVLIRRFPQHNQIPNRLLNAFFNQETYEDLFPSVSDFVLSDLESYDESEWKKLAKKIGKYRKTCLKNEIKPEETILKTINERFQLWLEVNYGGLSTKVSRISPVMVHHIPNFLEKIMVDKIALIVMDGMSFTQWSIIQQYLSEKDITSDVEATFSWIPSLTSVSRQAIFSGKTPNDYSGSIGTTNKENIEWQDFWTAQGFEKNEIYYKRSLGLSDFDMKTSPLSYPQTKVFGGVIDIVDKSMHGALQGLSSVQAELEIWLKSGYLTSFLNGLFDLDFDIYMTSDHGNIEAIGAGSIREGILVETSGQRVRVYENEVLRSNAFMKLKEETNEWHSNYLPGNYKPLLAVGNNAFIKENCRIVTHGGSHIEEIIVPFIKLSRGDKE